MKENSLSIGMVKVNVPSAALNQFSERKPQHLRYHRRTGDGFFYLCVLVLWT